MNLKYYPELDALRGIAALMVLFFHFMPNVDAHLSPVIHLLYKTAIFGQTGVTLFFVLSGFLITRILLYTKRSEHYFAAFYVKRALRIFPLYYLALTIFFVILPLITGTPEYGNGSWMYWIYLQNFADTFGWRSSGPPHFWSLAVEEHFYLFWPIIVYYSSKRQLVRPIIIIIFLAFICRLVLIYLGFGTFYFTFSIMDAFAIGAILAWMEAENKLQIVNFNYIIVISLLLLIPSWLFIGGKGSAIVQLIKFPVIALFYAGIIGKLITEKSWFSRLFLFAPLTYTGKISYGMYVFHPMCFMVYNCFFPGNSIIVNFLCCVMFTYIVATISFYAYEVHFIKLKRHFEPADWWKELGSRS